MSLFRIASKLMASANTPVILLNQSREVHRWVMPTLSEIRKRRKAAGPQPKQHRSEFLEWNYEAEISAFGVRLSENFSGKLLQQAFVDRSYIVQEEMKQRAVGIENPVLNLTDNSRLVKKGEDLIADFTSAYLSAQLPKLPRDGIKAIQQHLMSEETLAHVSSNLGTKDLILTADFPVPAKTLASSLKAVIAALSESSGDARAYEFIRDFILTQLNQVDVNELWKLDDPMELLTEICKDKKLPAPEPRLIAEEGRNTLLAAYQVGLYSNKRMIGSGFGEDVTIATQEAAKDALRNFFKTNTNMKPFDFRLPVDTVMKTKSAAAEKM